MEKTVGAYEARQRFGQLIEEAFYNKDAFVVERSGRPMAVIVPIDHYKRWKLLAKEQVFAMLEEVWKQTGQVPTEELEQDVDQALATLRKELLTRKKAQTAKRSPSSA